MIQNKKGSGENDFLVYIIVGIIALVLVIGIFFRANIIEYVRNLPDLGSPEKDKLVYLDDDKIINGAAACQEVGRLEYIKRGEVGEGKFSSLVGGAKEVVTGSGWFSTVLRYTSPVFMVANVVDPDLKLTKLYDVKINGKDTNLFIHSKGEVYYIAVKERSSENIGLMLITTKGTPVLNIDDKWINDDALRVQHPNLPSKEELILIDDSYIEPGPKICKKIGEVNDK